MKRSLFSCPGKSDLLSKSTVLPMTVVLIMVVLVASQSLAFAQTTPVNFVSGHVFSGVGHGDRIPGAANVYTFAVGDFNNDGNLDMVTTNDSNVWGLGLVLGNGDGTFQPPIKIVGYDTYGAYGGIGAGDFNKDGNLDFAVLSLVGYGPVQLSIYLNDGHGNFTPGSSYTIGTTGVRMARTLATTDLNGDGNLDLVVPERLSVAVAVLYGKGDGTFPTTAEFPVAPQTGPTGVAVGDFNKDSKPDIVVASSTGCCPYSGGISVLINAGNGTFSAPVLYSNPYGVDDGQVAVADLNADGKLDVAESSLGGQGVSIFLGNGDGTFQAAKYIFDIWPSALAIGNLTSDKKPDIVTSSYYDGTVWVLINKGSGNFQVGGVYSTEWGAKSIALADFNGDKKLDFVTGSEADQFMTVASGNGDGTFRDSAHYNESGGMWANDIAVADFNRDGNLDIVEAGGGPGNGLSLMLGTSHGVPKAPTFINLGANQWAQVTFVRALDINGDSKPDIVCGGALGLQVLLGLGTGKFKPPVTYASSPSSYPVVGWLADLNGDNKLDIVATNNDGTMSSLINNGKGIFGAANVFTSGTGAYPSGFVLGDFNGDGKTDIMIGDFQAANLKLLLGNGSGTFQAPLTLSSPVRPGGTIAVDFNKDGKLDLALVSNDYSGSLAIFLGNGNGTFSAGTVYKWFDNSGCSTLPCDHYPNSFVAVDLNGDNNLDLAIAPRNPWYLTCGGYRCAEQYLGAVVYLGKGDGTFTGQFGWLAGVSPSWVAAGDFNSDGMPDLAYLSNDVNYGQTSVTVLQNSTQPVSVSPLSIKFPAKVVGTSSKQTVLLTNNQANTLTINSIAIGGANPADFSAKSACGSHLLTGANCLVTVTFAPTTIGNRMATLIITDSAGVQSVQLNGVGK
jgi:hypothetical protein